VVDYYMYRLELAATRMPQSSQGTSEAWPGVDYEVLLHKFCHEKWAGSGRPSRPASDGPVSP